ncbi:MAG: DUF1080 domain-containing protein [Prolixibacteraceae bacterium]|nr:DUF1080 domain-containing protein [Prolixibacteraceae bacterium]
MKNTFVLLISVFIISASASMAQDPVKDFSGMWTIEIDGGAVGWIEVHDRNGFVDADLLWRGGSVLPVSNIYFSDKNTMVVTRTGEVVRKGNDGQERKHIVTQLYTFKKSENKLKGELTEPSRDGRSVTTTGFTAMKLPDVPGAPDLSKVRYGDPVMLFNGKDISNWRLTNPDRTNGFKVINGVLVNDPVQKEGRRVSYGNLRTNQEFEDFNLTLEVNVPSGSNSGVYLRGMYEIQVLDSYGKELDSHNMGALYSRITPAVAAEKPAGEWQSMDITLCKRHLTVRLNGITIIDNKPVSGPTGGAIIADVFKPGPIFLQGDHGKVSYRNIVLRPVTGYDL